jgi:hypothetical protein
MGNGGALLDKLFVIVETIALNGPDQVVKLELLAKRRIFHAPLSDRPASNTPQSNTKIVIKKGRVSRSAGSFGWI